MATLTAVPEPGATPPRVRLDVGSGSSATLEAVTIRRNGATVRYPPAAGATAAFAYDYEAPYGVPVTYTATGTTVGAYTNEWSESWANLSAWTGDTGSFVAVSGEARASTDAKTITRMATNTIGRVTVGGSPRSVAVRFLNASGAEVARLEWVTVFFGMKLWVGSANVSTNPADGPATIVIGGGRISVQGSNWTLSLPFSGTVRGISVTSFNPLSGDPTRIGAIAVAPTPATTSFTVSTSATLSPSASWLVHPTYPSLSVPFEGNCPISMGAETRAQVTSQAQRNVIPIQGASTPVVVVNGRRAADAWTLALNCPTLADRSAVRTLLDDQTPVLVRSHSAACDIPDGWYSVGDYGAERPAPIAANEYHRLTLPMQPVREPAVALSAPRWTYSNVALVGSYADVQAKYGTYTNLVLGVTT